MKKWKYLTTLILGIALIVAAIVIEVGKILYHLSATDMYTFVGLAKYFLYLQQIDYGNIVEYILNWGFASIGSVGFWYNTCYAVGILLIMYAVTTYILRIYYDKKIVASFLLREFTLAFGMYLFYYVCVPRNPGADSIYKGYIVAVGVLAIIAFIWLAINWIKKRKNESLGDVQYNLKKALIFDACVLVVSLWPLMRLVELVHVILAVPIFSVIG